MFFLIDRNNSAMLQWLHVIGMQLILSKQNAKLRY